MKQIKSFMASTAAIFLSATLNAQTFDLQTYIKEIKTCQDKDAFNSKYLTINRGHSLVDIPNWLFPDEVYYGDNSATANLYAIAYDIVPDDCKEEVLKNLITDIIRINGGHFVGDSSALPLLLPTLSSVGRTDVAELLSRRDSAILGGQVDVWRRTCLSGLKPLSGDDQTITLKPDFTAEILTECSSSYDYHQGTVTSAWTKDLMNAVWTVNVPKGAKVTAILPDGKSKRLKAGENVLKVRIPMSDKRIVNESFLFNTAPFLTCHSASITETESGDLLAVFSGGTNEAAADNNIYLSRKSKGSDKWSQPVAITPDREEGCVGNPVIFQIPVKGEDILLMYHEGHLKGRPLRTWLARSSDGGHTWSEHTIMPEGITLAERSQPIYVNGRIIAGGDCHRPWQKRPVFCISEDMGHTWTVTEPQSAEYAVAHNNRKPGRVGENFDIPADNIPRENAFEILWSIHPAILQHKNGALQSLGRTCHSRLSSVWSDDGGLTWGHEYLTDQICNQSGFSAITLKDGRFVKVFNNFESLPGVSRFEGMNARTPLTLAISDDGIIWKNLLDLEDGPIHNNKFPSGYCYPNVIEGSDGYLHVVYTWQRVRIKYVKIKL